MTRHTQVQQQWLRTPAEAHPTKCTRRFGLAVVGVEPDPDQTGHAFEDFAALVVNKTAKLEQSNLLRHPRLEMKVDCGRVVGWWSQRVLKWLGDRIIGADIERFIVAIRCIFLGA